MVKTEYFLRFLRTSNSLGLLFVALMFSLNGCSICTRWKAPSCHRIFWWHQTIWWVSCTIWSLGLLQEPPTVWSWKPLEACVCKEAHPRVMWVKSTSHSIRLSWILLLTLLLTSSGTHVSCFNFWAPIPHLYVDPLGLNKIMHVTHFT